MNKLAFLFVFASLILSSMAIAMDESKIDGIAMHDAEILEKEASQYNQYHRPYTVTVEIAEDFLHRQNVELAIIHEFPDPLDRAKYHTAFIAWIQHEIDKRD